MNNHKFHKLIETYFENKYVRILLNITLQEFLTAKRGKNRR